MKKKKFWKKILSLVLLVFTVHLQDLDRICRTTEINAINYETNNNFYQSEPLEIKK